MFRLPSRMIMKGSPWMLAMMVVIIHSRSVSLLLEFAVRFFFFQAEDGIRDVAVTGVQTCALPILLGGALRDLEPQLLARLAPGEWRVMERTMAPTRYRTELGAALKYTLQAHDATTGRAETLRYFVKVYRNDHGEPTFELLQSLGQRVERGETGYSVVRPVAYRKDLRTLVLEEAPGPAVLPLLREGHDP